MECTGNGADHCCYVESRVCPHLEENTIPGRRWSCGLLRKLGSWEAVHKSEEYLADPKPTWDKVGIRDCGDWFPIKGQCCLEVSV